MKVYLDDIKKIGWLRDALMEQSWGQAFLNTKKGFYYVFYYNQDNVDGTISIEKTSYVYEVNDSIYRTMTTNHVGYIKEPFDTSNYLFYSILLSSFNEYNELNYEERKKKLQDLFLDYKAIDIRESKDSLKIKQKASLSVDSRISFSDALHKIFSLNQKPVHGICSLYELIDLYTKNKFGKSIYGQLLTGFVRGVPSPNGGLIPEYAGSTMRYLIIGERAAGDDESLKQAKLLLRSGNNIDYIYWETGWYYNKLDFKWRKRISDDSFSFCIDKLTHIGNGSYLYVPEGHDIEGEITFQENIASGKTSISKAVGNGYNVRLSDYIQFDEAFKYYPALKDVFGVLLCKIGNSLNFYFSKEDPNILVLCSSDKSKYGIEEIKYVALHEMQHYIQDYEGFASGGNPTLATLVDVLGGSVVRSYIISLTAYLERFNKVAPFMINLESYEILIEQIKACKFDEYKLRYNSRVISASFFLNSAIIELERLTKTEKLASENSQTIAHWLIVLYSMIPEVGKPIQDFISKFIGEEYIEFFKESLSQNKKALAKEQEMMKRGWTANDLYILNFNIYQSLLGEVEARFTQQTSKIPKGLIEYFKIYSSETIDYDKVNVINDSILYSEKKAEAALETKDGKYLIHFSDAYSNSINILHETAHMLYDFEQEAIVTDADALSLAAANEDTLEEYFCNSFVDYIHRKNIDPMLTQDLKREVKNLKHFDTLFDNILNTEFKVNEKGLIERLNYLNKLLENA